MAAEACVLVVDKVNNLLFITRRSSLDGSLLDTHIKIQERVHAAVRALKLQTQP